MLLWVEKCFQQAISRLHLSSVIMEMFSEHFEAGAQNIELSSICSWKRQDWRQTSEQHRRHPTCANLCRRLHPIIEGGGAAEPAAAAALLALLRTVHDSAPLSALLAPQHAVSLPAGWAPSPQQLLRSSYCRATSCSFRLNACPCALLLAFVQ